jgi:uncharacterized protein (TIGR00299 family) protein
MKVLYFDCFSGISGNMILGALMDAGFNQRELEKIIKGIKISNYSIKIKKVIMHGISAINFQVVTGHNSKRHVPFCEIIDLLKGSGLKRQLKERALHVFDNLAAAEAKIHGCAKNRVEFHEVGAIDAIIDIVGSIAGFDYFEIDRFIASEVPLSRGNVDSSHGKIPLPAPAVIELLKNVPVKGVDYNGELVTPTGAAILKTLCSHFGVISEMSIERVGYGAGDYDDTPLPDVLRILIGKAGKLFENGLWVIEANIDDMNPQLFENVIDHLLHKGAIDVFVSNIIMKKGRPGFLLTVLVDDMKKMLIQDEIFKNTTTIGIRSYPVERNILERRIITKRVAGIDVRFKLSYLNDRIINEMPEYEDVKKLARQKNITLKDAFRMVYGIK